MEAALIATYHRDYLGDYLATLHAELDGGELPPAGRVSLRQLRVLIDALPPDSALHRAVAGHTWREETHLLALIADLLQTSNAQVAQAAGAKGVKKPTPVPRPETGGDGEEADRTAEARQAHRDLVAKLKPTR